MLCSFMLFFQIWILRDPLKLCFDGVLHGGHGRVVGETAHDVALAVDEELGEVPGYLAGFLLLEPHVKG